ncbi:WD40-repeat-containing domain protein [Pavlovales sp. CCMP2436]|nr:WD40-repeat-containing domain protein [Pavlovales sp. CCMP2436]
MLSRREFDRGGHTGGVLRVSFHPSSRLLASCGADQRLKLWDVSMGECMSTFHKNDGWIYSCIVSHTGSLVACACADQHVRVFDLSTLKLLQPLERGTLGQSTVSQADKEMVTFKGPVQCVDFSPEDTWLCAGAADNKVTLWRVSDGECYQTFEGHVDAVTSVRFSFDGMMILSASYDGSAKIWRVSDGHLAQTLTEHTSFLSAAEWGERGQLVATGSGDHRVLIWDPEEGRVLHELLGHQSWVLSVAFAPRDHILASSGADRLIFLWDALTGAKLHVINAHTDWVESVTFDPTGIMLASAGHDRDIRIWDVTDPTNPTERAVLTGRWQWPLVSWFYYVAVDVIDLLRGSRARADQHLGILEAVSDQHPEDADPKLSEMQTRVEGRLAERAMALVRDDVLGLKVALASLFLQYAGEDGRVPKNAFANACMKDLMLKELLMQEDAEHRTVERRLRESTSYVTWEELLDCFEIDSQMFERDDSIPDGFRISVLGF